MKFTDNEINLMCYCHQQTSCFGCFYREECEEFREKKGYDVPSTLLLAILKGMKKVGDIE